ncbi:PREDICTED: uncharacterized protein LOC108608913 isoform X1 [Drosophila arizonae]|uniref:Uncharacterized protein LOC108608913 isoform X1 n=1 Tax=Drosophila arizonae TaxID=7263 RepID=A0ABM1NM55_DROAR|nr:PREDICTED: uncharacterized protein LOC108608913 isoform X1 [Drosophila arizonae]
MDNHAIYGYGATRREFVNCPRRQRCQSPTYVLEGGYRSPCKRRSRHCFVVRTPPIAKLRPESCRQRRTIINDCDCSSSQLQPEPILRRTCRPSPSVSPSVSCCCPPVEPTISYNCFPIRQPMPETQEICVPRQRVMEPKRSNCRLTQHVPALPYPNPPDRFAPAMECVNAPIDEPIDPYYNYDRNRQSSIPGVAPLANFDLNRYDRDNIGQAGSPGRRRNVSIRTCVDYDYEPGHPQYSSRPPPQDWRHSHPQFIPVQRNRYPPPSEYDWKPENRGCSRYPSHR